jgi:serine/threonine protein kinase
MSELKLQQCRLDGRYDILECLGRGSYAEIYVARDTAAEQGMPQTIVIKALNVFLQGTPDEDLERTLIENFQNEAVALDRVRHPNIISRLGHGTAIDLSGRAFHYIVLEYLSGGDMAALSRKNPLTLERALFYLEQVCAGLAFAHEHGVIHRDIKPQNLLLTADTKTVKIADFGVAKIEASEGAITRVGTNVYAPPEHNPLVQTGPLDPEMLNAGRAHLTPAADIYSLAKTTLALLTGESPRHFSHRQISELPATLAGKSWAAALLRVLKRATSDKPAARYQTVQEYWSELEEVTLPPTQLLPSPNELEARQRAQTIMTTGNLPQVAPAPPRPRFESARAIVDLPANGNNNKLRPRIVVPVTGDEVRQRPESMQAHQPAREIIAALPNLKTKQKAPRPRPRIPPRVMRPLVALLLILLFAGMLFATYKYVRAHKSATTVTTPVTTTDPVDPVGHEGVMTTDVNLRPDPSTVNPAVGLAEMGSRVKVLSARSNWYEVQVLKHSRDKDVPSSSDRGWIKKNYLNFD